MDRTAHQSGCTTARASTTEVGKGRAKPWWEKKIGRKKNDVEKRGGRRTCGQTGCPECVSRIQTTRGGEKRTTGIGQKSALQ